MKKCPWCAELIQDEAVYCRYCHKDIKIDQQPTSVLSTKLDANVDYKYLLDAEKINRNGKLDLVDIGTLANISINAFIFPKSLIEDGEQLISTFIRNVHMPILANFRFPRQQGDITKAYLKICTVQYTSMSQISLGMAIETYEKNYSGTECFDFCLNISAEILVNMVKITHLFENAVTIENRKKKNLEDFITESFRPFNVPFLEFTADLYKLALLKGVDTLFNQSIQGQSPFSLELKRLSKACFIRRTS